MHVNETENAMRNHKYTQCWNRLKMGSVLFAFAGVIGVAILPAMASAQDKKDEISFDLVANPSFVNCLRKDSYEEPRARATVIRGKLNDTLILDLDGFKPGLAFDLFTVQRSPFLSDKTADPNFKAVFKGSFGLAWFSQTSKSASVAITATFASRRSCSTRSSALIQT
jgi:hypothetical protein